MSLPVRSDLVLETEIPELVVRELVLADEDRYFRLVDRNRAHLNRHGDHQFEADATRADITGYFAAPWDHNTRLGLWLAERLVGRVDLVPVDPPRWVLGYWLDEAVGGRGLMTAACRAVVGYPRTIGATEIYAGITNGNERSVGVVTRLGFRHVQDVEDRSRWRLALVDDAPPPVMA